jgi:dGTP triphosphohydrolase
MRRKTLLCLADRGDYTKHVFRIVHSEPYGRMASKSQLFVKPASEAFRTRLSHTEEVLQIAKLMNEQLELNGGLIETMCRGHDIGHTPFGHVGERVLQRCIDDVLSARPFKQYLQEAPKEPDGRPLDHKRELTRFFHHATNSARLLAIHPCFIETPDVVISGVSAHGWSPWTPPSWDHADTLASKEVLHTPKSLPLSYEAQLVSIADQVSSAIHDIRDLYQGRSYTHFELDDLIHDCPAGDAEFVKLIAEGVSSNLHDTVRSVCLLIAASIASETLQSGAKNAKDANDETKRLRFRTGLQNQVAHCEMLREKVIGRGGTWFATRDSTAGAYVRAVFDALWARSRSRKPDPGNRRLEPLHESFCTFRSRIVRNYRPKPAGVAFWDGYIRSRLSSKHDPDALTLLVDVVDYVASLTDRSCVAVFRLVEADFEQAFSELPHFGGPDEHMPKTKESPPTRKRTPRK